MTPPCPLCQAQFQGGASLVDHFIQSHHMTPQGANKWVDNLYAFSKSYLPPKSNQGMPPNANVNQQFLVAYEHLTAQECEELKERVKDKEKTFTWGTYGPVRDEDLQHYSIDNLSSQHLENILITQPQINNELAAAILMLLKKRYGVL
jgi:hypothetical protein